MVVVNKIDLKDKPRNGYMPAEKQPVHKSALKFNNYIADASRYNDNLSNDNHVGSQKISGYMIPLLQQ